MSLRRLGAVLLASVMVLGGGLATASAQSKEPRDRPPAENKRQDKVKPTPKEATPKDKEKGAEPDAQADAASPAGTGSKLPGKLPQTAEEKRKQLSDLYALLATADDEEQSKKIADRIERIWALTGSDTLNLLLDRATKAMHDKRLDLAEQLLDAAVTLVPDSAEAFNRRAFFHFTQNNFQSAAGDLRRVLALDPNHYKALEGLAQIWRETGNKKGAYEVMKQLMDVYPFAPGAKAVYEELKREVDGQGI